VKRWIALGACVAALAVAEPAAALPNLTISLPQQPWSGQLAPVYVDTFEQPGHVLYRFDALIHNEGSTLDLFRRASDGHAMQALWTGDPDVAPDPYVEPSGVAVDDRTANAGASIEFVDEVTHDHFHFFTAARYELEVPGAAPRVSPKIGFCMFDSFDGAGGTVKWFPPDQAWCHSPAAQPGFTRMGLSSGASDRYAAQREFQFVDITGLQPGDYELRGIANPEGSVLESDGVPDVHAEVRSIPGVLADDVSATSAAGPVPIQLHGRALGVDVPGRLSAACTPRPTVDDCYAWARPGDLPRFDVTNPPAHGTVSVAGDTATYAPVPGFSGDDRFTYTATDARGLVSAPATVTVHVLAPMVIVDPPWGGPRPILSLLSARKAGRRAVVVRLRCRATASGACAGRVAARARGRGIGARRFAGLLPGRAITLRIRHTPTHRRITIHATARDATGRGLPATLNAR
jgi:hypothetical protein